MIKTENMKREHYVNDGSLVAGLHKHAHSGYAQFIQTTDLFSPTPLVLKEQKIHLEKIMKTNQDLGKERQGLHLGERITLALLEIGSAIERLQKKII